MIGATLPKCSTMKGRYFTKLLRAYNISTACGSLGFHIGEFQ
jgi:hypothetical protein